MKICCIPGCDVELSKNSKMKTCPACRQSLHSWEKRRPAEIVQRAHNLKKYTARMNTFSSVVDDEVQFVDHATLEKKGMMRFAKRKAKSIKAQTNVVQFRKRASR